jgi:nitrate/TMAO reductase-like tetraheme cytochrome c subunit
VDGFQESNYTIEKHNQSPFPLKGAHLATPCFACHKKETRWEFREIGTRCIDCHENIHEPYLDKKYYPEATCSSCHSENRWSEIEFDHNKTDFKLQGAHKDQTCRECHFRKNETGKTVQVFGELTTSCLSCHKDIHYGQFDQNGSANCLECHGFDNWKASRFDHGKTRFKLDGAHEKVPCKSCHKPVEKEQLTYILYKIEKFKCEDCHK